MVDFNREFNENILKPIEDITFNLNRWLKDHDVKWILRNPTWGENDVAMWDVESEDLKDI